MKVEPISLVCADCDGSFVFSVEEQRTYASRSFAVPKRCPGCRATKRRRQTGRVVRPRVRAVAEDRPARPRDAAEWHVTSCTTCGGDAEVPFRPDGIRAVYCMPCLKQRTR